MNHTELFNEHRSYLFAIAYRMLGSIMDAEDMVQESFVRWEQVDLDTVDSAKAYLASIITRLCIDQLRSARVKRETYVGSWLPEPIMTEHLPGADEAVVLADSLSMAFLVLLEKLSPSERAVFLLHEVFDYNYAEIAGIVGKREDNCRQLMRRAKQRVEAGRPRYTVSFETQQAITTEFAQACLSGDLDSLVGLLAEDVMEVSDSGGKVTAALNPIYGRERVSRFFIGIVSKIPANASFQLATINHQPGIITYLDGQPYNVVLLDIRKGDNGQTRIQNIHIVINPDKLQGIPGL